MCNFLSAIVMKSGDLICDPEHSDSHEDLLESQGIRDNGRDGFIRVEFLPPKELNKIQDLDSWVLKVDRPDVPDWFDHERTLLSLRNRTRRMIVDSERPILLGGCWILVSGAVVKKVQNARIFCMVGDSQVRTMWDNSRVGDMYENSWVGDMRDNSRVGDMWGSSHVGAMRENSRVETMRENSQVRDMWGSSQVGVMWDNSQVTKVKGNAQILNDNRENKNRES